VPMLEAAVGNHCLRDLASSVASHHYLAAKSPGAVVLKMPTKRSNRLGWAMGSALTESAPAK
jgi:hypothetical protein